MTISLKHKFVSEVADGGDDTVVRPSNWNDEHDLDMASGKILGRVTEDAGPVEELDAAAVRTLINVADGADVTAAASFGDDNRLIRSDGTGKGVQASPVVVADTTGALSRAGGGGIPIQGTNTSDNAAAGYVGEVVENTASGVSMTTATAATVVSMELSAGDWDVFGASRFVTSGGATVTSFITSISLTPGTVDEAGHSTLFIAGLSATEPLRMPHIMRRLLLSETTTVYLTMSAVFASGALEAQGRLIARRMR